MCIQRPWNLLFFNPINASLTGYQTTLVKAPSKKISAPPDLWRIGHLIIPKGRRAFQRSEKAEGPVAGSGESEGHWEAGTLPVAWEKWPVFRMEFVERCGSA